MRPTRTLRFAVIALVSLAYPNLATAADKAPPLVPGVRGLITRAPATVKIDGRLEEWSNAFCTSVHYNHANLANRAAQFFYLWDEKALYIGLRALDQNRANDAPLAIIADGDAVELYLDARPPSALRGKDWTKGAIHLFFTPFEGTRLAPRWVIRAGIATSDTKLEGIEIASTLLPNNFGYEIEFKIPWTNFSEFTPKLGAVMGIDAELCSSDGARRTDRTFAYGSPLSVQQPASQGLVQLVGSFDPDYLTQVGPAAFPFWVETPWHQGERARVQATVGIPPAFAEIVGEVEIRLHNTDGTIIKTIKAHPESFGPPALKFVRAVAWWSIDEFAPNSFLASARVLSRTGKPLTTVAPRLVEEAQMSGR
jgi:hypothetical protein